MHEQTHVVINNEFGCDASVWGVDWKGFYVQAYCPESEIRDLAQSINEVVGYCIFPFLYFICLALFDIGLNGDKK